jgi:hypothetical protein
MSFQDVLNLVLGTLIGIVGWIARTLWDAVTSLKNDLSKLREEIANDRVHKDDFKAVSDTIMRKLDRIEDKLDSKADK